MHLSLLPQGYNPPLSSNIYQKQQSMQTNRLSVVIPPGVSPGQVIATTVDGRIIQVYIFLTLSVAVNNQTNMI